MGYRKTLSVNKQPKEREKKREEKREGEGKEDG